MTWWFLAKLAAQCCRMFVTSGEGCWLPIYMSSYPFNQIASSLNKFYLVRGTSHGEAARSSSELLKIGGVLRGNTIRGNRPERFWEGNLPLRGSLRGPLRGMVSELFRAFQRFLEVFRGSQRFSEVFRGFQRFFKRPLRDPLRVPFSSQSCRSCCP